MSYLGEWQKRRIEYWQPALYFSANGIRVDFNICAKNACSSIKGYFSWVLDPNSDSLYKIDDPKIIAAIDAGVLNSSDISNMGDFAYLNHISARRINRVTLWLNHADTTFSDFFRKNSIRVAIKRDPIKRFVSGYRQIYDESAHGPFKMNHFSIDDLLNRLESGEYWNEHLETQTWWMGDKSRYDKVFDITNTDECIQYINNTLKLTRQPPSFHRMKSVGPKPELTRKQIARIEKLYIIDYENGWY